MIRYPRKLRCARFLNQIDPGNERPESRFAIRIGNHVQILECVGKKEADRMGRLTIRGRPVDDLVVAGGYSKVLYFLLDVRGIGTPLGPQNVALGVRGVVGAVLLDHLQHGAVASVNL